MKIFDIDCFGKLFCWHWQASKKQYLVYTILCTIAFFLPMLLTVLPRLKDNPNYVEGALTTTFVFEHIAFMAMIVVNGAMIQKNLRTKQQRIVFKMLPATDFEKFIMRYLHVTVGMLAATLLGFVLADLLQMLICKMAYGQVLACGTSELWDAINNLIDFSIGNQKAVSSATFAITFLLMIHSFYMLGGAFFRKQPVVFTSLLLMFLCILHLQVIISIDKYDIIALSAVQMQTVLSVIIVIQLAVTAVCYWLTYLLFKRMQVINNKWINL